jgi:hypothetical protein
MPKSPTRISTKEGLKRARQQQSKNAASSKSRSREQAKVTLAENASLAKKRATRTLWIAATNWYENIMT